MVSLVFTEQQLQIVNDALLRMPYGVVAGLIQEINMQLRQQMQKNVEDGDAEHIDGRD